MAARVFVSQFLTEEGIAEVHPSHPITVSFDARDERDFRGSFFAALRDARDDLVNRRGLRLDRDKADKYVVPSVVRMWASGR